MIRRPFVARRHAEVQAAAPNDSLGQACCCSVHQPGSTNQSVDHPCCCIVHQPSLAESQRVTTLEYAPPGAPAVPSCPRWATTHTGPHAAVRCLRSSCARFTKQGASKTMRQLSGTQQCWTAVCSRTAHAAHSERTKCGQGGHCADCRRLATTLPSMRTPDHARPGCNTQDMPTPCCNAAPGDARPEQ